VHESEQESEQPVLVEQQEAVLLEPGREPQRLEPVVRQLAVELVLVTALLEQERALVHLLQLQRSAKAGQL
jgi:hypothetical protein